MSSRHHRRQAARKLRPGDVDLPERLRTLTSGEAFVSLGGDAPGYSPCHRLTGPGTPHAGRLDEPPS